MKRCPECRRDYHDDSLLFCLEDGVALIQGSVPSPGEPQTQILSSDHFATEQRTRSLSQPPSTGPVLSSATQRTASKRSSIMAGVGGIIIVAALSVGSYFYYERGTTNQISSIAVMPFVNNSGNPDVEYLSDGMTETLIRSLSQLPDLSVKSRSLVFRYKSQDTDAKTLGQELGVQAVLKGWVVQRGDRLLLNLELIDASNENVIWTDEYDRKSSDLITLQNEIARDVSSRLRIKLSGADKTRLARNYTADPEAYRLYLQGRFYWYKQAGPEYEKCADYFRRAIEKDPNFALGYVGLADYYGARQRDKAKENVNRALTLDPDLAEANGTLGYQYMLDYDWLNAERYMKRALELDDKNLELHRWNGQRLMMTGRFDEALASYDRALEIDPSSSATRLSYGACLIVSGKLNEGTRYLEDSVKADPTHAWLHSFLGHAYDLRNDWANAAEQRAIASELLGRPEQARATRDSFAKGGRDGFLRELVKQRETGNTTGGVGAAAAAHYMLLGEKEKALQVLEGVAERKGDFWLFLIKHEAVYDPLRGDPRFQALLKIFDAPK
jgi:TolB-like protein/Flp pilus assembly protein TadD